jgi:hypothetical protein
MSMASGRTRSVGSCLERSGCTSTEEVCHA